MRTVEYIIGPQMGQPGPVRTSGNLSQLLMSCIGVVELELIPPLFILNEILQAGADFNKQHRWTPFQIDEQEYEELIQTLLTTPYTHHECIEPPDWVCTPTDWYYWSWEHRVGIPAQQHRELSEESHAWHKKSVQASKDGNKQLVLQYHLKFCQIGQQLTDLMEPYLEKYREALQRRRKETPH